MSESTGREQHLSWLQFDSSQRVTSLLMLSLGVRAIFVVTSTDRTCRDLHAIAQFLTDYCFAHLLADNCVIRKSAHLLLSLYVSTHPRID